MRHLIKTLPLALILAGCSSDITTACCTATIPLRVINAFTTAVDVLADSTVIVHALAAGDAAMTGASTGTHTLSFRPVGGSNTAGLSYTSNAAALQTVAAVRLSSGNVGVAALDDTNSVVPARATKVRVLHLAPNAGIIQVYRTQPDYQTPISWQFPFTYQSQPTPLTAPFFQSTVGTWDVRVWQSPADASGWANAALKISIPLATGEKKTVLILDKPGGGIRYELL